MKVSVNTIKQLVGHELPPVAELVERINAQLGGVEEVIDLSTKYADAKIVRVVESDKHPDADRLNVCKIDDGTGELVQVVCGAPNVHAGMYAVWLPPNSVVPSTAEDAEPFVLGARELRGVMSNGMLAAGDELGINNDHDGIIEVTETDIVPGRLEDLGLSWDSLAGASFAEVFELNDTIIDIENKMFTHRPDCFGQLGVARELFAILQPTPSNDTPQDIRFQEPKWYWSPAEFAQASGLELTVFNEIEAKVPRIMAVAMQNVIIKPSPLWLQTTLVRWGSKSINNVVDLTNYIMLLTAQPTHAYDYDKLRGHTVGARMARSGEVLPLLNGKTYELTDEDIVIADAEGAIGLAGIMGGGNSEVSASTTNVVLEVANFDMYTVRKSAMRHGVFTDALTRFNKGQSPLQNDRVMSRLMELMSTYASAEQASEVFDIPEKRAGADSSSVHGSMNIAVSFINARLGLELSAEHIGNLLRFANFAAHKAEDSDTLMVTAPFWRTDIELPEDIVEEVGRLYGFDKLPRELPRRATRPAPKDATTSSKQALRATLEKLGANEVLTYSFVHEKIIKKAEQNVGDAYRLSNALSPDLQYYRLSVLPSLLDKVHMNIKAGNDEFVLYEIGKGHSKSALDADGLPKEIEYLDAVYASKKPREGAAYFVMRRYVQQLCLELGFSVRFRPVESATGSGAVSVFDPDRSAAIETMDGTYLGVVGELKISVMKQFKLPEYTAAMTLELESLVRVLNQKRQTYAPLSKFPSINQDISLKVTADTTYEDVFKVVYAALAEHDETIDLRVTPVTIYQADDTPESKTVTLRVTATSHERTLRDEEVSALLDHAADSAAASLSAKRI